MAGATTDADDRTGTEIDDALVDDDDTLADDDALVEEDLVIEEISIDGMCGVY